MSEKINSIVNCPDTDIFPDKMLFKTYPCLYYEWLKWIHDNCCSGGGGTTINAWTTNKSYSIGDIVTYHNNLYRCKTDNTDISFNYNKWEVLSNAVLQGYDASTTYDIRDVVTQNGNIYKCNTAGTTGVWNISKWDLLSSGPTISSDSLEVETSSTGTTININNYNRNASYRLGNLVIYLDDNCLYKAKQNITAPAGNWDPSLWTLIGPSGGASGINSWMSGTNYSIGDVVTYHNNTYRCSTANSDSTFTYNKWEVLSNAVLQGYDGTNNYVIRDVVSYNGNIYKCNASAGTTGTWDPSKWDLLSTGTTTQITIDDFDAAGLYAAGDLVTHDDNIYRAKISITPGVWTASDWELISIGLPQFTTFSTTNSYYLGDKIIYNGNLYQCNKTGPIAGAFNASDWTLISTGQSITGKADKQGSFVSTVDNTNVLGLTTSEVKTAVSSTNKLLTQADAIQGLSSTSLTVDTTTLTASTVELKAQDTTSAVSLGTGTTAGKLNVKTDDLSITKNSTDGKLKAITVTDVSSTNKIVTQTELAAVASGTNILGGWWYAKTTTTWTVPTPTMTTENYIDLSATPVKTYTAKTDLTGWDQDTATITPSAGDVVLITEAYWDITQANTGGSSYYTSNGWVHVPASVRDVDNISIEVNNNILSAITNTATTTTNKIATMLDLPSSYFVRFSNDIDNTLPASNTVSTNDCVFIRTGSKPLQLVQYKQDGNWHNVDFIDQTIFIELNQWIYTGTAWSENKDNILRIFKRTKNSSVPVTYNKEIIYQQDTQVIKFPTDGDRTTKYKQGDIVSVFGNLYQANKNDAVPQRPMSPSNGWNSVTKCKGDMDFTSWAFASPYPVTGSMSDKIIVNGNIIDQNYTWITNDQALNIMNNTGYPSGYYRYIEFKAIADRDYSYQHPGLWRMSVFTYNKESNTCSVSGGGIVGNQFMSNFDYTFKVHYIVADNGGGKSSQWPDNYVYRIIYVNDYNSIKVLPLWSF